MKTKSLIKTRKVRDSNPSYTKCKHVLQTCAFNHSANLPLYIIHRFKIRIHFIITIDFILNNFYYSICLLINIVMKKQPIITYTLITINVIVFILETIAWGSTDNLTAFNFWAQFTPAIASQPRRLFTAMFLHFGIIHLAMNMLALYNLWPSIEHVFWKWKYILIYLFSGIAGNLTVFWVESITGNYSLSAWASWAIFWLLWAYLALSLVLSKESKWQFKNNQIIQTIVYALAPWFFITWISLSAHIWWLIWWFIISYILIIISKRKLKSHNMS